MSAVIREFNHDWHYLVPFTYDDVLAGNTYSSCPICLSKHEQTKLVGLGKPEWPDQIHLVQCGDCKTLYYKNPPTESQITSYYERTWNTKSGETVENSGASKRRVRRRFSQLLSQINHTKKDAKILDIGCGTGDLLAGLEEAGYKDLWGTEMSPYRIKVSQARFPNRIFEGGYEGVPDDMRFDIIYANHVFEHIYNPRDAFAWMKAHLTDSGFIILSVPDSRYEPVVGQVLFLPHLFSFGHESFQSIADQHDMTAYFWTKDRYWDMTCVFSKSQSRLSPPKENFSTFEELNLELGTPQEERIRSAWIDIEGSKNKSILIKPNRKRCTREDLAKGYQALSPIRLATLRLRWATANILDKLGATSLRAKLLKDASFLTIIPGANGDAPLTIHHMDGTGVFDVK